MKKVLCILSLAIVGVFLTASTVYACCGIYAYIADDPIDPVCLGDDVTISGTITGVNGDPYLPQILEEWPIDVGVEIEITTPSGDVIGPLDATLSNYQYTPGVVPTVPGEISYDFSLTYTPTELGLYTYVKTARFVTSWDFGGNEYATAAGEFEVIRCLSLDIKGGSCPNPLNRNAKGGTPVAILGPAAVLAEIDLSSLTLAGVAPMTNKAGDIMMQMEDSTQPGDYDAQDCYDCFDADANPNYDSDGDGVLDTYIGDGNDEIVLKFDLSGLPGERGDCITLTLTGSYNDGDPIDPISDAMIIVK